MTAFNLADFNLHGLKSAIFPDRHNLPCTPGVYFVVNEESVVLYVGMSKNIQKRWRSTSHHLYALVSKMSGIKIAYLDCPREDLTAVERSLIERLRPILNDASFVASQIQLKQSGESNAKNSAVPSALRTVREELGMSVEEVAFRLGVSAATVQNWEAGRSKPKPDLEDIPRYLDLYKVDLTELIELVKRTFAIAKGAKS